MNEFLCVLFVIAILTRLNIYFISKKNEEKLLKIGGKEYGKRITYVLSIIHTLFYVFAFLEGYIRHTRFDFLCLIGTLMTTVSFLILMQIVNSLGKYWTIKLIFADSSIMTTYWLFKYSKYPNYYFNIIPELLGISLIFHSWLTMFLFIFPYSICLYIRIEQENYLISNLK